MNPAQLIGNNPRTAHTTNGLRRRKPGLNAVLMKAVSEIAPAEPRLPLPLQAPQLALRAHCRLVEERMSVIEGRNHSTGSRRRLRVERHKVVRCPFTKRLQPVHPVSDGK